MLAGAAKPRVATVIVSYNPPLGSFLEVLAAQLGIGAGAVYVVDNGSRNADQLAAEIRRLGRGDLLLLRQERNLGVAAAQNIGIRTALATGCSHLLLFDQDSRPAPDTLSTLLAEEAALLQRGVPLAALGPAFYDPRSGSFYLQARIAGPLLRKVALDPTSSAPLPVSFIIASGTLVRAEVLARVGLMREGLFIDKVDIEWCLRARAHGLAVFVSPRAVMTHQIGDSRVRSLGREISLHAPLRRYYMARNTILLSRLPWLPLGYRFRELFSLLTRTPVFLCSVRFSRPYLKLICLGILHGLLGREGEYRP